MPDNLLRAQIVQEAIEDADIRRVLSELGCWGDEHIPYARTIAADIGMPAEQLHRILKRLIAGSYVTYGPVYREDDGMPFGSSYWLTERGEQLRNLVSAKATEKAA